MSIYRNDLETDVDALRYDFSLAAIDPNVRAIYTFASRFSGTAYFKRDGGWEASGAVGAGQ